MPTILNYMRFIYVHLGFMIQVIFFIYLSSILEIKKNWASYRCIPYYWIFSDNISTDFKFCVENTQLKLMSYLMQPFTYLISNLTKMGGKFVENINSTRFVLSDLRDFFGINMINISSMFYNIIVEFQKIIIGIKDTISKLIGVVVALLYILDGSVKTIQSAWNGPTGKLVTSIGSCFNPNTEVKLQNGEIYMMKNIPLGSILEDGGKVFSVLKVSNFLNEKYYKIKGGVNNNDILVTGNHFIFDKENNKWVKVKDYDKSIIIHDRYDVWFSCLITTTGHIKIGDNLFWDWEDDILNI